MLFYNLFVFFTLFSFSCKVFDKNFIPQSQKYHTFNMCKDNYLSIAYYEYTKNPLWSYYKLTQEMVNDEKGGRLNFVLDPELKSHNISQPSPNSSAFSDKWNRGHYCPSYDMSFDADVQKFTYYMSNIVPQDGKTNQHTWKMIENKITQWVKANRDLYIITGSIYNNTITWGDDNIAIPDFIYKAICDGTNSIAMICLNNNDCNNGNIQYMSVTGLGKLIGYKVFDCNNDNMDRSYWW